MALTIVAAFASVGLAAGASATTLTSPSGTEYTGAIKATSTNSALDGAFVTVTCSHSEAVGKVSTNGGAGNASGAISSLTFTGCNYPVSVKKAGTLEINSQKEVISKSAEISIETSVGTCVFTTTSAGTKVGTLTTSTGLSPAMDINSALIPRTGGNFLCGSWGTWTGSYTVLEPGTLLVD